VNALLAAIADFGLATVAAAVLIFILLRGEIVFRYPRRGDPTKYKAVS
jgi:hypothetical protein